MIFKKLKYGLYVFIVSGKIYADPAIHQAEIFYRVQGETAQELREAMNNNSAVIENHGFDAYTHWYVRWNFEYQHVNDELCKLSNITVSVDITSTLPQWNEYNSSSDSQLKNLWNNYLIHLKEHEIGHAENGKNAAIEIETLLNNLPEQNCEEIETIANRQAKEIIKKYNNEDIRSDEETQHGRLQGAIFP